MPDELHPSRRTSVLLPACSGCGAAEGQPCTEDDGKQAEHPHPERIVALTDQARERGAAMRARLNARNRPTRERPSKPRGPGWRWYSICSSAHDDPTCPRCAAGSWSWEPYKKLSRLVYRVAPGAWRRWANRCS
jgi:hypothetical protein